MGHNEKLWGGMVSAVPTSDRLGKADTLYPINFCQGRKSVPFDFHLEKVFIKSTTCLANKASGVHIHAKGRLKIQRHFLLFRAISLLTHSSDELSHRSMVTIRCIA
jgi:hypothetical protein